MLTAQGMRKLHARSQDGSRLDETLEKLQRIGDEQELARPVIQRTEAAVID